MATCRSCNASITWATSARTGKPMPLDFDPSPIGNLVVIKGVARHVTPEDRELHRETYVSHFATCPQAGEWRQ